MGRPRSATASAAPSSLTPSGFDSMIWPSTVRTRAGVGSERFGSQLFAHLPEHHDDMVVRPATHLGLEHHPGKIGRGRGREIRLRLAVVQHFLQHPLDVRGLGRRERDPEALTQHTLGGQTGDARGRRGPCGDRPVGRDRRNAVLETVQQLFRVHAWPSLYDTTPRWPYRGRNGADGAASGATTLGAHGLLCQAASDVATTQQSTGHTRRTFHWPRRKITALTTATDEKAIMTA